MYIYEIAYLILGGLFAVTAIFGLIGWRNSIRQGKRAETISQMLIDVTCNVEDPDEKYARLFKMTKEEFRTECKKGNIMQLASQEISKIAEGLQSPFKIFGD